MKYAHIVGLVLFGLVLAGGAQIEIAHNDAFREARDRAARVTAETESARCFALPPMCSGQATPVCVCGFYASSCVWVCNVEKGAGQ